MLAGGKTVPYNGLRFKDILHSVNKTPILSVYCLPTDTITESTVNHPTFQLHHLLPGDEVCVVKTSYFQRHKPIATLPLL